MCLGRLFQIFGAAEENALAQRHDINSRRLTDLHSVSYYRANLVSNNIEIINL